VVQYFSTSTQYTPLTGAAVSCKVTKPDGTVITVPDAVNTPQWSVKVAAADLGVGTHAVACFVRAATDGVSFNASLDARLRFEVTFCTCPCLVVVAAVQEQRLVDDGSMSATAQPQGLPIHAHHLQ
jgi:hypothetical protein